MANVNTPYDLPPDPRLRRNETGYGAELAYVDRVLGDLLAFLERLSLLNNWS